MSLHGDWRHLLVGCDASQRDAIVSPAMPLLVVAGAGSGKTRVLTRRIAWRIAEGHAVASRVLALTFTRKAAGELRGRLNTLGLPAPVAAGTFHAMALAELRRYEIDQGRRAPVLLERKAQLLADLVPERATGQVSPRRGARQPGASGRRQLLRTIAQEIEWAAARRVPPDRYANEALAADRAPGFDLEFLASVYAAFQAAKRKRGVVDFDDLLARLTLAIETDADFAAAERWRFHHFFVDELQDATPAQLALLDAWLGGRRDLFAVGDPRQSIYGWSGADPGVIEDFTVRYPGATVLRLDTNYRSTPQVVAVAGSTLSDRVANMPAATRPDGRAPTVRSYPDDRAEAAGVAQTLRLVRRPGRRWSSCAVLARTNAQLVVIEAALSAAGIPARSLNGAAFLDTATVRSALEQLDATGASFAAWLADLSLAGDDAEADCPAGSRSVGADERAVLWRLGREYLSIDPSPGRDGFLAWARSSLRSDASPIETDAVELTTFHRAKGLEWEVVFVTGLEEGLVPIHRAHTELALDEERRLLYVALTRAVDELYCSWAAVRHFGEAASNRQPSRYLEAIAGVARDLVAVGAPDPATTRATLSGARALLDAARTPDPNAITSRRRRPSPSRG